jgi:hypothetical protein
MCQRVTCNVCKKPTFSGCGRHVEEVLGNVPKDERCRCDEQANAAKGDPAKGSWVDRFLRGQ